MLCGSFGILGSETQGIEDEKADLFVDGDVFDMSALFLNNNQETSFASCFSFLSELSIKSIGVCTILFGSFQRHLALQKISLIKYLE